MKKLDKNLKKELIKLKNDSNLSSLVNKILKSKNINEKIEYGNTAIIIAIENNHIELVKLLIQCGVDICIQNFYERTALYFAIKYNNLEIAKLLIDTNREIIKYDNIYYLYETAIDNENIDMIKFLLENNVYENDNKNCLREVIRCSIFSSKITKKGLEILKIILDQNIDLNSEDYSGSTIFTISIEENVDIDVIKLLLEYGANLNYKFDDGDTPLSLAIIYERQEVAELLIEKGADINSRDISGDTIFIKACLCKNFKLAKLLLEKGVNINEANNKGETALTVAIKNNDIKLVKYLLEYSETNALILKNNPYGANPNVMDHQGKTPLYKARKNIEMFKMLLEHGTDPNLHAENEDNLIFTLIKENKLEQIKLLIKYGVDINMKDSEEKSILLNAIENQNIEVVCLLLELGAHYSELEIELAKKYNDIRFILNSHMKYETMKKILEKEQETSTENNKKKKLIKG